MSSEQLFRFALRQNNLCLNNASILLSGCLKIKKCNICMPTNIAFLVYSQFRPKADKASQRCMVLV
ncbi:MAG: hypothetical protein J6U05_02515 [Neisseriaceae bacterium]|nr:hypothetical protein [Neisseriaceae bacterium]MBO7554796.1 hypothetical protein [Neisseriaceae bacterium]